MSPPNPKLVADLAQLAKKYPPNEWRALIAALDDEDLRRDLRRMLEELATTSTKSPRRTSTRARGSTDRPAQVRAALEHLAAREPDRARKLEEIWSKLRAGELLPTLPLVRAFADAAGVKGIVASKREQAIHELMIQLVAVPTSGLEEMMRRTVAGDRRFADEYAQWAEIIMRRPGAT